MSRGRPTPLTGDFKQCGRRRHVDGKKHLHGLSLKLERQKNFFLCFRDCKDVITKMFSVFVYLYGETFHRFLLTKFKEAKQNPNNPVQRRKSANQKLSITFTN